MESSWREPQPHYWDWLALTFTSKDADPVTPGALFYKLWAQAHCGADTSAPSLESLVFNSVHSRKLLIFGARDESMI